MKKINLMIEKSEDICEKYNHEVLDDEISQYIEKECLTVKKRDKIVINIISPSKFSKKEEETIEMLIRNNYRNLVKEQLLVKEYQVRRNLILVLLGILFVIVASIFEREFVLSELFLIVGWFAIWEVIDRVLFDGVRDKIKTDRYRKLARCQIMFQKEEK